MTLSIGLLQKWLGAEQMKEKGSYGVIMTSGPVIMGLMTVAFHIAFRFVVHLDVDLRV